MIYNRKIKLLTLLSCLLSCLIISNIKADTFKQIYDAAKKIQNTLEQRLASEFKKESDFILAKMCPSFKKAEECYELINTTEASNLRRMEQVIADIHKGIIGNHTTTTQLVDSVIDIMRKEHIKLLENSADKVSSARTKLNEIINGEDIRILRDQANSQVNLFNILDLALTCDIFGDIFNLTNRFNTKLIELTTRHNQAFNKWQTLESQKKKKSEFWDHCQALKDELSKNQFKHLPKTLFRDHIVCDSCKAEVYSLQESDLLYYYHNYSCIERIKLNVDIDNKLKFTVQQRIRTISINECAQISKSIQDKLSYFKDFYGMMTPLASCINAENYVASQSSSRTN